MHNIAKGIPPRVHLPKFTKPKPSSGKKDGATKAALTKKDCKQDASTSGDESEEQSKDLELKARKKKHARGEEIMSEEEVEVWGQFLRKTHKKSFHPLYPHNNVG